MRLLQLTLLGIIICLSAIVCNKIENNLINIEGTIYKQGITTYQYGTHTITGYALRSSTINIDNYIGKTVTVVGRLIEGYPIEGGPDYIEVEAIK